MEHSMNGPQQLSSTHKDEFVFKNTLTPAAGNGDLPDSGDESDSNTTAKKGDAEEGVDEPKPLPKRSGRRKIKIEYIEDKNRRHITFSKRKAGIMKKAYELSTLTGTQVLLLVVSETGLVYTFTTVKLQPIVTKPEGKNLIQQCLNAPDPMNDMPPQLKDEESSAVANAQQQEGNAGYDNQQQLKEETNVEPQQQQAQQPQQQPYPSSSANVPAAYPSANAYNPSSAGVPYAYPTATATNTNSNTGASIPALNAPYGYNTASAPQGNSAATHATSPQQHQQAYLPNNAGYYQPYMTQYQQQAPTGYWPGNTNASAQQQSSSNEASTKHE